MNSRERVLSAARRQKPDRVPVALAFFPFTLPETGGRDADEYLNTDVRYVDFGAPSAQ
jgi:hypothetical protein